MSAPRVLVALGTEAAWSRGILRGFMEAAHDVAKATTARLSLR